MSILSERRLRIGLRIALGALVAGVLIGGTPATAQSDTCDQLRQQLSGSGTGEQAATYARAAQRQRVELARTQSYAQQIGCDRGFSFFDDTPRECGAIENRIQQMTGNLQALETQSRAMQYPDPARQEQLQARYDAMCSQQVADDPWSDPTDPLRQGFDDGPPQDTGRRGHAICVRSCDGGYFPLGPADGSSDLGKLDSLCSALCPNTEAKLYTTPDTDDLNQAVSADGAPYSSLPAAFRFQKTFDAACTCKPQGRSWVEALAQAEAILGKGGGNDVTVTPEMSDNLSRPTAAKPTTKARKATRINSKSISDAQAAAENALGSQAPTASTDSAGISAEAGTDRMIKAGEGQVKTETGPDGVSRRVRIISPAL